MRDFRQSELYHYPNVSPAALLVWHAYCYCVSMSRAPRDDWDEATLILIVLFCDLRTSDNKGDN